MYTGKLLSLSKQQFLQLWFSYDCSNKGIYISSTDKQTTKPIHRAHSQAGKVYEIYAATFKTLFWNIFVKLAR